MGELVVQAALFPAERRAQAVGAQPPAGRPGQDGEHGVVGHRQPAARLQLLLDVAAQVLLHLEERLPGAQLALVEPGPLLLVTVHGLILPDRVDVSSQSGLPSVDTSTQCLGRGRRPPCTTSPPPLPAGRTPGSRTGCTWARTPRSTTSPCCSPQPRPGSPTRSWSWPTTCSPRPASTGTRTVAWRP